MCFSWCSFSLSSHPQIKAELAPWQKWMNLSGRGHKSFVRKRVRSKVKGSPWSESAFECSCCGHWRQDVAEAARGGLYSMSYHYRCSALKFCPVFVYADMHTHTRRVSMPTLWEDAHMEACHHPATEMICQNYNCSVFILHPVIANVTGHCDLNLHGIITV